MRTALNNQGLTSADDFVALTEEEMTNICTSICRPGGTLPNPIYDAANPIPGVAPTIPNPGISIVFVNERRLKMLRWYVHHLAHVQCSVDVRTFTLARLQRVYALKEQYDKEEGNKIELPER